MKQLLVLILLLAALNSFAQQQPDRKPFRIADTLTAQEKLNRNTVILQSELDSLVEAYNARLPKPVQEQPEKTTAVEQPGYLLFTAIGALLVIALLLYVLFRNQKKFARTVGGLHKQIKQLEWTISNPEKTTNTSTASTVKGKPTLANLEKKIVALTAELEKKTKENEGLEMVLNEYRYVKQEYESVKQQMMDVYKVRNYPGYSKDKTETEIIKGMLGTEKSVAAYAYEHFLKPVIAIADANKNNPAKISKEEKEKMLDLLVSLALLYSEYLYLRVYDLSVGGKMVERIAGFNKGNGIDASLLKELNTEHGSRALALRIALDKMGIQQLSYPVFEETNLNLS